MTVPSLCFSSRATTIIKPRCNWRAGLDIDFNRLYLFSHYFSIGCSGIGAYYDNEVRKFLETDKDVLYAVAIGI